MTASSPSAKEEDVPSSEKAHPASEARQPLAPLDLSRALKRMGGDEELLAGVAQFFLEDAPVLLRQLRCALDRADEAEVCRLAHSLKGLAANFDAHAVIAAARQVELQAAAGDLSPAAQTLKGLEIEIARLERGLEPVAKP